MKNYIGKWIFHSVGVMDEEGKFSYLNAEEYLNSPMPYIDENDEEAKASELRERKQITSSLIEICDNGKLLMLIPIPKEEYEAYLAELAESGEKELRPGMACMSCSSWEERDGDLWFDSGIEGEAFGETIDGWSKPIDANGFFNFMTMRYEKE